MESSLANLKNVYDRCAEYISYLNESAWVSRPEDVSEFWAEIFRERKNYPEFNDMLVMRRGATCPLADRGAEAASDRESEFRHAQAAYFVTSKSVPDSYFQELEESALGCPVGFDFQGRMLSAGAITNALTSYRIIEWCKSTGLVNRPLRILEIGAGYGQVAYQLFQQVKIACYTICDLPENLFLSAFYLQANLPSKKANFVRESGISKHEQAELVFVVPPFLKKLPGPFDLVINSYSFQEMNRASVDEYFHCCGSYADARWVVLQSECAS
jgi:putative sugar O-methyltransferase